MDEKKKRNILKKMGSLTMAPYALKAAGYDKLADATGYPYEDDGSRKPDSEIKSSQTKRGKKKNAPKYEDDPLTVARKALGFKSGGRVKGYKDGGAVCQGGGKAMAGTKFRGVR